MRFLVQAGELCRAAVASYGRSRAFLAFLSGPVRRGEMTGAWPDKTIFILEFRNSSREAKITNPVRFQTNLVGLEAEVKDSRFPGGWAFFNFRNANVAEPLSRKTAEGCNQCHREHGAVEQTFVQFYPTLLEVARQKGTLKPGF